MKRFAFLALLSVFLALPAFGAQPVAPGISGTLVNQPMATLPLFHETFTGSVASLDRWKVNRTGMFAGQHGGWMTLDSTLADATAGDFFTLQTWRTFPIFQSYPVLGEWRISTSSTPDPGTTAEWGFGIAGLNAASSTSGAFFRLGQALSGANLGTTVAKLYGIVSYATVEDTVVLRASTRLPTTGFHRYRIEMLPGRVEFSIDDRVEGSISLTATAPIIGSSASAPAFVMLANNGTTTANAARVVQVGEVAVWARDVGSNKPWGAVMSGMGNGAYQVPSNTVASAAAFVGQTANWANSAGPTVASLSNTAASYTTLGGGYRVPATAGAPTDYALFVYTVAGATDSIPGRTLHITGVRVGEVTVDSTGLAATQQYTLTWGIGVGSSANSLAGADNIITGSGSTTYRRMALGTQSFASTAVTGPLVGSIQPGFQVDFSAAPLMVPAGDRVAIILRMERGATTAGVIFRGTITVMGYFE